MRYLRLFLLWSCWLGVVNAAQAQGRLTGVVQDSASHEPLAFASVFLAGTTLGATTTEKGTFVFEKVPKGTYDIVGSYVGYRLSKQSITVGTGALPSITLKLASSGPQLNEVVVQANPHQEDDYRKFAELFLGRTTFSKQCRITNPEEVDVAYNDTTKVLTAKADNFVQVENQALGYRIKYFGLNFQYNTDDESVSYDGQPIFEELKPRDEKQQRQWEANRLAAYNGSLTHFLRSVYDNRVQEEGFLAQQVRIVENPRLVMAERIRQQKRRPTAAEQDSMRKWSTMADVVARLIPKPRPIDSLRRVSADGEQYLRFTQELQVCYFGEAPDPNYKAAMSPIGPTDSKTPTKRQVSRLVLLANETRIRPNGSLANPLDVSPGEYWGFQRIGEFLPADYEPPVAATPAPQAKLK
jgi:hypothetical protein